ncbi:hypothetical protein GGR56DRAFT_378827 [Xylariaceae sp. FL0804]|nr:hypothetical protein GGR56DRAFT_378827 [Xylariaceae sp. FL0804]
MCWMDAGGPGGPGALAGWLADLLLLENEVEERPAAGPSYYHVDNAVRQPWDHIISLVAAELGLAQVNNISLEKWVRRVRIWPEPAEDNPAARLVNFLDDHFLRMSWAGTAGLLVARWTPFKLVNIPPS